MDKQPPNSPQDLCPEKRTVQPTDTIPGQNFPQLTINDLRKMKGTNGLAFLDCNMPPQEVLDLINRTFAYAGILPGQSRFEKIMCFQHDESVDLVIPFGNIELESTKLVIWQAMTFKDCRGVFLSDYIYHRLAGSKDPNMGCPFAGKPKIPPRPKRRQRER